MFYISAVTVADMITKDKPPSPTAVRGEHPLSRGMRLKYLCMNHRVFFRIRPAQQHKFRLSMLIWVRKVLTEDTRKRYVSRNVSNVIRKCNWARTYSPQLEVFNCVRNKLFEKSVSE